MADTVNADQWMNEHGGKRFAVAVFIGLSIELAALGGLLPFMAHQKPPPSDHQSVVKLSVIAPAPAPAPPPPKPIPPPPKPVVPPPPVPPPPPLPVTPPLPLPPPPPLPRPHRILAHPPPPRHVVTAPIPPPVQQTPPAPPPPPSAPAAPSAGELDLFQAAMRRAVQAAAITPEGAQLAHETGVVRVSFVYQQGAAENIQVVTSSGFPLLDNAAIQAVRDARFPPQPPDFAGRPDNIEVDVIFRAAATDIDSD